MEKIKVRKVIITDLARFSYDEEVCVAAVDMNTGECFRPIPYLKNIKCAELNIQPGSILEGDLALKSSTSNPHIEDSDYTKLNFVGIATAEQFKSILESTLSHSIASGFGIDIDIGQKHIPVGEITTCSIITVKVPPSQLSIHEDQYKPGKIKASFTDESGHFLVTYL